MNKYAFEQKSLLNKHQRFYNIMRMTFLFLFFCILFSQASNSYSQEPCFTLKLQSVSIKEVFNEIENNSDYIFVFSDNAENEIMKKTDIDAHDKTAVDIVSDVLKNTNLKYRILNKQIVIYKETDNNEVNLLHQQQHEKGEIKGIVVDNDGNPLPGVNITMEGYKGGFISDMNGTFSIFTIKEEEVLTFSFMGFVKQTIHAKRDKLLKVVLKESISEIDEVVITGYQTVDKRESASSVYSVKASDIMVGSAKSIDQMLSGVVPGMAVMTGSGEPSATPRIRIRGNATINGNKSPVWVVDGVIIESPVPFNAADINSDDAVYLIGNAIAGINPQDIESITVLKDASATAIYGVKAANGVIVITTKEGKAGKPVITYNGNVSINQRPSYSDFDRMNAQERLQLSKEIVNLGYDYPRIPSGDTYEGALQSLYKKDISYEQFRDKINHMQMRNTDWYKEIFRNSISNNHNISISGGRANSSYYVSIGYNNNLGATENASSTRFTSLAKINVKLNDRISFQTKLNYSSSDNEGFHESVNPHQYAYKTSRTLAPYDENGEYALYIADDFYGLKYNFLKEMAYTGKTGDVNDFNGLFNLNINIANGLKYQGVLSLQKTDTKRRSWAEEQSYNVAKIRKYNYHEYEEKSPEYNKSVLPFGGILAQSFIGLESYTLRNTLDYKKMFNGGHDFQTMAGFELRSNKYKGLSTTGYGWVPEFGEKFMPVYTDNFISDYVRRGALNPTNTNKITQVASIFGILTYSYKYRYVLNANIRSDGSNKFGSNPRYRWLPTWSVAGKWIISKEPFLQESKWMDNLALRASYGVQGNIHDAASPELVARIMDRDYLSLLDKYEIYRLPNPYLRWEKTNAWNIALDFTLFDQRLKGSFEVYKKHTSDLIHDKAVPSSNGRQMLTINSGEMDNSGFEGFFNLDLIRSKTFNWTTSFNFAQNINKVILANNSNYSDNQKVEMMLRGETAFEGEPIGSLYSFKFAGLSAENGFPLFYAKDGRKVHIGEPFLMELVNCGSIFPKITGGFDHQFTYKNRLSLGIGFYYNIGGVKRLPTVYDDANDVFDPTQNVSREIQNRWKQPGDEKTTSIPAIYNKQFIKTFVNNEDLSALRKGSDKYWYPTELYNNSDVQVATADFLRLRHISLSYMLNQESIKKYGLNSCVVRLQATNLHVWTSKEWRGLDPETPNSSIPVLPVYSIGLNLSF